MDDTARTHGASLICTMVESAAVANGLPLAFFARVIWQESRLRPDAVGPMTRSGRRAQGIAQFMPLTAAERHLLNPFDPVQALPKSAEFLRELRAQFGNLGLAAAAYNAGPQRVRDWLGGKRTLPSETQAFVHIVTGRPAREWIKPEEHALTVQFRRECRAPRLPRSLETSLPTREHRHELCHRHQHPLGLFNLSVIGQRPKRLPSIISSKKNTRRYSVPIGLSSSRRRSR